ncbi:hypothetical protein OIU78_006760 [Salix suchowensis]|nr:hypothetical protein OIU78_006760 [Salix suchowensis]
MAAQQQVQKNTLYVGGLAEEVNEAIIHAAFIPFGDIKDVKTPLDQATQKHRSFGFVTFLEREDAASAMDNMDGSELYGRVLTVNYALPEKIKGGEQGWAAQPIWADADTWFERQQQEEEMQRMQAENRAAMQAAEDLHRKKMAEEREGEKEDEGRVKDDPMARAEVEVLKPEHILANKMRASETNYLHFAMKWFFVLLLSLRYVYVILPQVSFKGLWGARDTNIHMVEHLPLMPLR